MTLYYQLPVYKTSYDLLLAIFQLTKNFKREYKYSIGQDLFQANSYFGLMTHYKTRHLRRRFYNLFSVYFWNYFYIERGFLKERIDHLVNGLTN